MNAFFVMDRSRRLGMVALCYVGLVAASSVYLGWHYAIDGYVSIAVVAILHSACKRFLSNTGTAALAPPSASPLPPRDIARSRP